MTDKAEWAEGKGLTIRPAPDGAILRKTGVVGLHVGTSYSLTVDQLRWLVTTGGPAMLAFLEREGAA